MAKMARGGRFGAFGGGIDRNGVRIRVRRAKKPPGGSEGRVSFDGRESASHLVDRRICVPAVVLSFCVHM